jgi:hypothetical protein
MFYRHYKNKIRIPYSGSKRIPDKFEHNILVIKSSGKIGYRASLLKQMFGNTPTQILIMNQKDYEDIIK